MDKSRIYTKFRGVHRDKEEIEHHIRFVIAIRDKWYQLRRDMISTLGTEGLEIIPVTTPETPNTDIIDIIYQHWAMVKPCIVSIKSGLTRNRIAF